MIRAGDIDWIAGKKQLDFRAFACGLFASSRAESESVSWYGEDHYGATRASSAHRQLACLLVRLYEPTLTVARQARMQHVRRARLPVIQHTSLSESAVRHSVELASLAVSPQP